MTSRAGVFAAFLLAIVAFSAGPGVRALVVGVPDHLSDQEFWTLTVDLSEPDAAFISDNLVSNEMSFAQVVPQLREAVDPGGVYLGVGPEQNFTYLSAVQARMGFIIDIRRGNLLLQLMYKALFELSANRAEFISRLFTRPRPAQVTERSSAAELMDAFAEVPAGDRSTYERNVRDLHPDGSLALSKSMQLLSPKDAITYAAGSVPALPSALFPIAKEVANCSGGQDLSRVTLSGHGVSNSLDGG